MTIKAVKPIRKEKVGRLNVEVYANRSELGAAAGRDAAEKMNFTSLFHDFLFS
ncbi:hypothetical protein O9H85_07005 [Paenibacillus filicis]|uniref:Uncharacterized protein n=1 Tax=Paenibacillus gyeongsangnamensis TaxID=3388067 RepID=A0ABT4Q5N0_9BACL|nr:hypothetical protein [Paenibacillus filicis]MCZ8512178.1 hypothetical protein [Paenibacillus filicis]